METTIKVTKETKERILGLDLSEKGKTFDMIINDLITSYRGTSQKYKKDYKKWGKGMQVHKENLKDYEEKKKKYDKEKKLMQNLIRWAKSKGFKP